MALSGCYRCLKCLMIVLNVLYWALGLSVIVVAIVLLSHGDKYLLKEGGGEAAAREFLTGTYVLFGVGAFLLILGFLGCCGAIRESPCMLCTFFVLMVCVIVAEVGCGAQVWSQSEPIRNSVKKQLTYLIQEEYSPDQPDSFLNLRIDAMQQAFRCCGINAPKDWAMSRYNGFQGPRGALSKVTGLIAETLGAYKVPRSCCVSSDIALCDVARQFEGAGEIGNAIFSHGCVPALLEGLTMYASFAGGIVTVAIGFEILGLVLALLLCFAARRDLKD